MEDWREKSQNLEILIENNNDPVILTDIQGKILAINSKYANFFNKNKKEIIGKLEFEILDKIFNEKKKKAMKKVLETKKSYNLHHIYKNKNLIIEIKPIFNNKGKLIKLASYIRDITEFINDKTKLESILQQSLMGIGIVKGNKVIYVNDAVSLITGYSKVQFLSGGVKFLSKIIHPKDKDFTMNQLRKKLRGDKDSIKRYKFRIISKSGSTKWLELFSKTVDIQGKNADLINIIDITKEKEIELNLKETEEKWNSLVNNLPKADRIIIIDKNGKILYVNRTYVGNENIIGKKIDEFFDEETLKEIKENLNFVFNKKQSRKYDTSIITPTGERKYFHSIAAPLKKDNKIVAALCIAIDNTELKNIEFSLNLKANYIDNIINSASEIIFTINKYQKVILWNKSAEKKTGYKKSRILNKKIDDIDLFQDKKKINEHITNILNKKKSYLREILIKTDFGNNLLLGISSSVIKDESNDITDILFVCWDITHDVIETDLLISGRSYILFDQNIERAIKIFEHYSNKMQKKLIISRDIKNKIKNYQFIKPEKIEIINFPLIEREFNNLKESKKLIEIITNYLKDKKESIILIDRVDYLLSLYSFENIIKTLYEINDHIRNSNSILLLRINPSVLNINERFQIEQEFYKIPSVK